MSLNRGHPTTAMPGPSVLPDRVRSAMGRQTTSIYKGELVDMTDGLMEDLKKVALTDGHVAVYAANGHGAWEAALRNTLAAGDRVLVVSSGFFSKRWGEIAETMGVAVEHLDYGTDRPADPSRLRDLLAADGGGAIKAVLAVQTETSSSVRNEIPPLRAAIDEAGHGALFMVDCVASLGCDRFEMDAWGVDVVVAGGQKGLMIPVGLSFVFFNAKADAARARAQPGHYFDWTGRAKSNEFYPRWAGSPPASHMFALREALDMMLEEGMPAIWARHRTIAGAVWAAVEAWGANGVMKLNIEDPARRGTGVTTINTEPGVAGRIRDWCEGSAGVTLGIPLGFPDEEHEDHFRIGHMGHLNVHMVMGVLGAVETAMLAQGIRHGGGALSAAAGALAAHPGG